MLASPKWEALGAVWSQDARDDLSMVWHRLSGAHYRHLILRVNQSHDCFRLERLLRRAATVEEGNNRWRSLQWKHRFARRSCASSLYPSIYLHLICHEQSKYADLTWDVVLSAELFGTYKPNGSVYLGAAHHLSLKPSECAMVATHVWDLRGAAAQGMRTVYVRRPEEGIRSDDDKNVKAKKDGGEVDVVVDSLVELAGLMKA